MFTQIEKNIDKKINYETMLSHLDSMIIKEDNIITTLSNLSAYLNYFLDDINWVWFYLFDKEKLYLGPFQWLPACTTIEIGKGVCGNSAKDQKVYIVDNVNEFEWHIACDSNSQSEIVLPIIKNNSLFGVLDIDSPLISRFDEIDKEYLTKIINKLIDIL